MYKLTLLFFCIILLASCGATRTAISTTPPSATAIDTIPKQQQTQTDSLLFIRSILASVKLKQPPYKTFSARADLDFIDSSGKKTNANTFFRIQKDSIIWISLRATLLNIEGARILITPDSLKLLNKQQEQYIPRDIAYIEDITGLPLDFSSLQNLLLGNILFDAIDFTKYSSTASVVNLISEQQEYIYTICIDMPTRLMVGATVALRQSALPLTAEIFYGDYEQQQEYSFATRRELIINDATRQTKLKIKFKQYSFNELLSFPFTVSQKYQIE